MVFKFKGELTRKLFFDALRFIDIALLLAAGLLSYWLRFQNFDFTPLHFLILATGPMVAGYGIALAGGYDANRPYGYAAALRSIAVGGALALFVFLLIGFSGKISENFSRIWLGLWLASGWLFLTVLRIVYVWAIRRRQKEPGFGIRTALIGMEPMRTALLEKFKQTPDEDIVLVLDIALTKDASNLDAA